ncbi:MAG: BLUF domain-containing protein [Hymenobacter sp.]|nr:MAG: BLUF domain-containing protein [Hymenobacter sp.]
MHHIIYLSRATTPFTNEQLQDLLEEARLHNAANELTGILLYGNDQFLQVLEGERGRVQTIYEHIVQDPRHHNVTLFADKQINARAFADWSMAYHPVDPAQFLEFTNYVSPQDVQLEHPNLTQADVQLLQLLRTFVLPDGTTVASA